MWNDDDKDKLMKLEIKKKSFFKEKNEMYLKEYWLNKFPFSSLKLVT